VNAYEEIGGMGWCVLSWVIETDRDGRAAA
jgi:hypothetical protein